MRVTLAGFNFDAQQIELIHQITDEFSHNGMESTYLLNLLTQLTEEPFTPETLSASYARISHSEKGIRELRRDARASVSRARRSNEHTIYGLGQASVAEHAVFNFDITGISRLALEILETQRMAAYTESSQRYISTSGDYEIPDEVSEIGMREEFEKTCNELFRIYRVLFSQIELRENLLDFHSNHFELENSGKAQEDARYVLPLACRGQVGMTINARTAAKMILTFNQSQIKEVKSLSKQLHGELHKIVPSLIRYTQPNPAIFVVEEKLASYTSEVSSKSAVTDEEDIVLLESPVKYEKIALAAMLTKVGNNDFSHYLKVIETLSKSDRIRLIADFHSYISEHDPIRPELELGYFVFRVTLSAAAYAQLKRHRLTTQLKQAYLPELGVTIPPSIEEAGCTDLFNDAITCSDEMYEILSDKFVDRLKCIAQYALTNAHRCRVIIQINSRELTHFARLHMDSHAQWDIRNVAGKMVELARIECPGLVQFACGKDKFKALNSKRQPINEY